MNRRNIKRPEKAAGCYTSFVQLSLRIRCQTAVSQSVNKPESHMSPTNQRRIVAECSRLL